MIGIHPVHRRLAELTHKAKLLGGYHFLLQDEKLELDHCLAVNFDLVFKLDCLKSLAFVAHDSGDMGWQQDICAKIEQVESKLL
ncbi:DUF7667 family protein [Paenibacillus harenae]|uniref:DUF7667 family protein n=1 Tax=Paenibacillus harenae TaxID=306543 RepID=UPI002791CD4C|nr:hypothetical protein [Paenibacillus harenae]MDQ0063413.1 hypothetical protein [Paenibacillus harenae]